MLEGKPATSAADIFSFGLVLLELLTWRLPWAGVPTSQARTCLSMLPLDSRLSTLQALRCLACPLQAASLPPACCTLSGLPARHRLHKPQLELHLAAANKNALVRTVPWADTRACAERRAPSSARLGDPAGDQERQPVWAGRLLPAHEVCAAQSAATAVGLGSSRGGPLNLRVLGCTQPCRPAPRAPG